VAHVTASGSIRPRALQKTLSACKRDFRKAVAEWQSAYPGFKEHLPSDQRARLKEVGRLMWCFDLRYRWATGITALEFDDEIVTLARTAPTREGYFLLMRLVDLWFSCDLAFAMYSRLLVPKRVENPNFLVSVKSDAAKRLRPAIAASEAAHKTLLQRSRKAAVRERFLGYLEGLAENAGATVAGESIRYGLQQFEKGRAMAPHHLAAIAQSIRNRYVHGGETAATGAFPAQEKVPLLRLLCGFTQVLTLSVATAAADELNRQLRMHARVRG
jgi:hypothetical protein